ncbi:uncharacterized protein [Brachyistius frenatus]|uniref:uncharacterized protein n=1 Tax=Brachyistius frenatus TaxID=100188 RepID=UPI0037E9B94C
MHFNSLPSSSEKPEPRKRVPQREYEKSSTDTGVAPCRRCTRCNLLNRLVETACSATGDTQCGQCVSGYYKLRRMTGEVELPCVPCSYHDTFHKECLLLTAQHAKARVKEEKCSVVLIGSATAFLLFLIALLLWTSLQTTDRFKQVSECSPRPEGLLSSADLQYTPLSDQREGTTTPTEALSQTAEDQTRGPNSLSHENDVHPTSIVINVATNIKPSSQTQDNNTHEEQRNFSTEEMDQKLQAIWEIAQGKYVSKPAIAPVQDLSLLLDSADNIHMLRRLGRSLGVPPQVIAHLRGFQDLCCSVFNCYTDFPTDFA